MFRSISLSRRDGAKLYALCLCLLACLVLSAAHAAAADQAAGGGKNIISKIDMQDNGDNRVLAIRGSTEPTYTIYELFKPSRVVVDVAEARVAGPDSISLPQDSGIEVAVKPIKDVTPPLTRFEFTLPQSYSFTTSQQGNDILITLENFNGGSKATTAPPEAQASTTTESTQTLPHQSIESQLPEINPLEQPAAPTSAAASMQDTFNFSGYNKERITVDFYKIDLHNVFRLLREVSGANIVVDESVNGSLTLALNDVPWDFALDIILNLKDLQKEERFNTIVIHPKSKVFNWPERAEDNLSFEADEDMVVQESLIIQQKERIPPAVVEAKKLIAKGRKAEKRGDAETAVQLYEQALKKWPKNGRLANKIAAIYLVQLRQNAKAAYYADKALAVDPKNSSAALNAAIAHANMQENTLAQQYFDQSVSAGKPASAALLSYAAFCEQVGRYDAAVRLLIRHDQIYGPNLNSMISRARVLDKKGEHENATRVYQSILTAGFRVPPDLRKFINGRTTLSQSM
jgi:type IV pilus assembly protein PilQ